MSSVVLPQLRPSQKYTLAAYYRDQKLRGGLPCSEDQFLLAVAGEILSLLPDARHDPEAKLACFERVIDQALQTDRDRKASGCSSSAFKNLPQSEVRP
jgi:hypothetical protein